MSTFKAKRRFDRNGAISDILPSEKALTTRCVCASPLVCVSDHKSTPEDSYIFVKKIPDEVPDNVLEAVILLKMVERTKGEDNSW